jgi:Ni/Co efflux regulator RcnB
MIARRFRLIAVTLLVCALAAPVTRAHAEDAKKTDSKPVKLKKNQAYVAPNLADYKLVSFALAPVTSLDRNVDAEKMVRQASEAAFSGTKYKLQGSSYVMELVRKSGVEPQFNAISKAAAQGAVPDSASLGAVSRQVPAQAILFSNVTQWQRLVVDASTRGQSFTQVGGDFVLVSLKDGTALWRGSFLEKGDGAYNDPNIAETTERDATGQSTARQAQLEPPSYIEVVEKLMTRVAGTLPKPATP